MKRTATHVIAILLWTSVSMNAFAAGEEIDIKCKDTNTYTRGIEEMPDATKENQILTVSFDNAGIYSLYIEDDSGTIVYSSALPADGMEYYYDLSGIGAGLYRLVLDGYKGEYEGYFSM